MLKMLVMLCLPATAWAGSLVSHWTFDGDALDAVGGNHGTLLGVTHYSAGVIGQAIDFDNLGAGVQVNALLGAYGTADYTISLWTKYDGTFGAGHFHVPVLVAGLTGRIDDNVLTGQTAALATIGNVHVGANFDEADNLWHQVVLTRSGTTVTSYVDGAWSNTITTPVVSLPNDGPHYFGRDAVQNRTLPGQIDDVQVYNYALSAAEVAALYATPGSTTGDTDGDGILDVNDNCPGVASANVSDTDGDGFGDVCADPRANIDPTVQHFGTFVGAKANVGANTTIGLGAVIGRRANVGTTAVIESGAVMGRATALGAGSTLGANAVMGYAATVGAGVTVGTGVRVGNLADVQANATVGANSRLGRASTILGGAALGTGVKVGPGSAITGGIAPTLTLGNDVTVRRGVTVLANAQVGASALLARGVVVCTANTVGAAAVVRAHNVASVNVAVGAVVPSGTYTVACP